MSRIAPIAAAACAVVIAVTAPGPGQAAADDVPRDATRGGVNGPASPVQRGRESPLLINEPPGAEEPPRIDVAVGETVERDVGFAIGLLCNDLTIIHAELRPGTPASNVFVVTGVRPGATLCRVGTEPSRPSFVFEVHVTARRAGPP